MMGEVSASQKNIIVRISDPSSPTVVQKIVFDALNAAGISFEVRVGEMPEPAPGWPDADIIIELSEVV